MCVLAISTVADSHNFWGSLKNAYAQLPSGARWILAVSSTDGTRAVNVLVHDSVDGARDLFVATAGPFGTTEFFEADGANAVGLDG
ncbi:MAG: hypothetical protein ACLQBX_15110 [Candidatus Limnocylindrales bacterium]